MRVFALLLILLGTAFSQLHASEPTAATLPQAIAATDAHLLYSGRWDKTDAKGPRCEWPAGTVRMNLTGSALEIALKGGKGHAFQVVVDGKPTSVITLVDGQSVYPVVADLPAGPHAIELCKRTECWGGPVQILGFHASADVKLLAPPVFIRKIEFMGDSITCGYGNEAENEKVHFSFATENAWLAWGAVTARALNAELAVEAVSGIWLMEHGKDLPLPGRWDRVLPMSGETKYDLASWQPDVVVINLGTNDSGKPIDPEKWTAAYRAFIGKIRAAYPKTEIFLTIGPMGHGPGGVIPKLNDALVAELNKAGETKVHAVALANQDGGKNGLGADWHPSIKTHQLMADQIVAAIRPVLGWKEGSVEQDQGHVERGGK